MSLFFAALVCCFFTFDALASTRMSKSTRIKVSHIAADIAVDKLDDPAWATASEVSIDTYWSGAAAPLGRQFKARLMWSATAIYVRFEANQTEPLVVSEKPDLAKKVKGLWDRDVCEIFIAPNKDARNNYFEYEIAPNGEWIDLGIHVLPDKRETDLDYASGMTSAARIERDKVVMAIRIPWQAFGKTPRPGDVWLGNLFRCVGAGATRGYLSWQPTRTKVPAFHVPKAFAEFEFVK